MSAKFKVTLKLQGLELEVEGSREDIPLLTKNVGAQIAGMLMPATNMVEGKAPALPGREAIDGVARAVQPPSPTRRTRTRRPASTGDGHTNGKASADIVWEHDANTWGTPLQTWKAVDKAVWLLYVAKQSNAASEMTVPQMVTTFDRLFRTSGRLNRGNIARDFQALNSEPPPKVHTNGTVNPPTWYLTDAGIKHAEKLVLAARGQPT